MTTLYWIALIITLGLLGYLLSQGADVGETFTGCRIGTPRSKATRLMAEARNSSLRPAGLSG